MSQRPFEHTHPHLPPTPTTTIPATLLAPRVLEFCSANMLNFIRDLLSFLACWSV